MTPLRTDVLHQTFSVDAELEEKAGAVAAFISAFSAKVEELSKNEINIVLSETITMEGRNKHRMHVVVEPAGLSNGFGMRDIELVATQLEQEHGCKISVQAVYGDERHCYAMEQRYLVDQGWIASRDWLDEIERRWGNVVDKFELGKVVVSCNPHQRLLRYVIPKRGVCELRVPHANVPGALKRIASVIQECGYNILSSRLSRTPPAGMGHSTSVFVAACEPLDDASAPDIMKEKFAAIESRYMIKRPKIGSGRRSDRVIYLKPHRREIVAVDDDVAASSEDVRRNEIQRFTQINGRPPEMLIFLSRKFIDKDKFSAVASEQELAVGLIAQAARDEGCHVVEALLDPDFPAPYDNNARTAVFSRLWACNACMVLAIDEQQGGRISPSMAHEIGFFNGSGKPVRVFVAKSRDTQAVIGNTIGANRSVYSDGNAGLIRDERESLYVVAQRWIRSVKLADGIV